MRPLAGRAVRNVRAQVLGVGARTSLALATAALLPRVMGTEDFGAFSAIVAVISILMVAASLGLQVVEGRRIPPLVVRGERAALLGLVRSLWSLRVVAALVAALLASVWLGAGVPGARWSSLMLWVGLLALSRYLVEASRSFLLPLGRAGRSALLDVLQVGGMLAALVTGYRLAGLAGALASAAVANAILFALGTAWLRDVVALRFPSLPRGSLKPYRKEGSLAFFGALAASVQTWLPVWMVARWAGPVEAAFAGVAVQVFNLVKIFFVTSRQAVYPVLAELVATGEDDRAAFWTDWMMRLGVLSTGSLLLLWRFSGADIVGTLWGPDFAVADDAIRVILGGAVFFVVGAGCNGYLYLRDRALRASTNLAAYALTTLAGVVLALESERLELSVGVAWAYGLGALVFSLAAYAQVRLSGVAVPKISATLILMVLPISFTLGLPLPSTVELRLVTGFAAVLAYVSIAFGTRLLGRAEIRLLVELAGSREHQLEEQ